LAQPKTLWVATKEVEISQLLGKRNIAIVMSDPTFSQATEAWLFYHQCFLINCHTTMDSWDL
jgi:hypothetical protein